MNAKTVWLLALVCAAALSAAVVRADDAELDVDVDVSVEADLATDADVAVDADADAEVEADAEAEADADAASELSAAMLVHMHSTVWGADACATKMQRGYDYKKAFAEFCRSFKKVYPASTAAKRLAIFTATVNCIAVKNAEMKRAGKAYFLRINHMSDETAAEFNRRLGTFNVVWDKVVGAASGAWKAVKKVFGFKFRQLKERSLDAADDELAVEDAAEQSADAAVQAYSETAVMADAYSGQSLDWRQKNVVGAVGSQGKCGNCWAWSASSAAESAWAMAGNKPREIAVQHLMDCAYTGPNGQTNQCNGGVPGVGLQEIIKKGGFCSEKEVAYNAAPGTCNNGCKKVLQLSSVDNYYAPNKNENDLFKLLQNGPVSVCIFAHSPTFMQYGGGVYDDAAGQPADNKINHAVLLVGYGTDTKLNKDYWIIMNSWAEKWGENGFIRIVRQKNSCLITKQWMQANAKKAATYGIVEDDVAPTPAVTSGTTTDVCTARATPASAPETGKCLDATACTDNRGRAAGTCAGRSAGVVCCLPAKAGPALPCTWSSSAFQGQKFNGVCVALADAGTACPSKATVESAYCQPMASNRCCLDRVPGRPAL